MEQLFTSYRRMLSAMAARHPDRTALAEREQTVTYARLLRETTAFAEALRKRGVAPGDRVGLLGGNTADWLIAYFGCLEAGAVCINLAYNMKEAYAVEILQALHAAFLMYGRAPADGIDPLHLASAAGLSGRAADFHGMLREIRDAEVPADSLLPADSGAPAEAAEFIALTSGSSSVPKAVALSQASQLYAAAEFARIAGERAGRTVLIGHPLYHQLGLQVSLYYLSGGGTVCLSLSDAPEEAAFWLDTLGPMDLTGMSGYFIRLNDSPCFAQHIAPKVEQCICAGAFSPQILIARLECRYDHALFISMYGQTECAPISIVSPRDSLEVRAHSAGFPLKGVSLRIVGEDGQEAGPGEIGQLLVKGPCMMLGYRKILRPTECVDGYFPTGDYARLDEEGRLQVLGRVGTEIHRRDAKVYPAMIEKALEDDDNVKELCILGLRHPAYGETAVAVLLLRDPELFDEKKTRRMLRRRLPSESLPSYLFAVSDLPRLHNGKTDMHALRARISRLYLNRMIADRAQQGITILSMTLKATIHVLAPVTVFFRNIAERLGYSEARRESIGAGVREALKQVIKSSPGVLSELRVEIRLYTDRLSLTVKGQGSVHALRTYQQARTDLSGILQQADDFSLEQPEHGAPCFRLDYLYENDAVAQDYLNLETGELLT